MKNDKKFKPDAVLKDYWRNNDRFADLFNQVFFLGAQQIDSHKLSDKDTEESSVVMEKGQTITSISRVRDVIKQYEDGIDLVLIGIENQMRVHYAMPVRSMTYEALNYSKQCKELLHTHREKKDLSGADEFLSGMNPSDKLKAAITLIVYYGEKSWDGPVCLSDMMNIPAAFQPFFNNYNIHLLQVCSTAKYNFQNQDNKDFFTLIEEFYNNEGKINMDQFKKKYPSLDVYWETLAALGAATGSMELIEYAFMNEGGKIHMCTALENLKKEGIQEGIKEGMQEGIKEGIQEGIRKGAIQGMIEAYREMGCEDDMIISKLKKKFGLSDNEVKDCFKP